MFRLPFVLSALVLAVWGCREKTAVQPNDPAGIDANEGAGGAGAGGKLGLGGASAGMGGATGSGGSGGETGKVDAAGAADAALAPRQDASRPVDPDAILDGSPAVAKAGAAGNVCPSGVMGNPLPQNRTVAMVRGGFTFLEGPVWVASQKALYFSDFSGMGNMGRIQKYTPADDKIVVFVDNVGTNGLAVDGKGGLVAASHDMQRVTRFDAATGMRSQIDGATMYMNAPFNSVNDLVVRADGHIYFTDPSYQRGNRSGQDATATYHLSPAGIVKRIGTVAQPNGISLSPDGQFLYVASSGGGPLRRFPLLADGSAMGMGTTISQMGSDGMAVDCAGNLYLTTNNRVVVLTPEGQTMGEITGFAGGTSNAAFGGEDGKTLYVTAGRALFQIKLNIPGLPN